jgi:hypothetical protein
VKKSLSIPQIRLPSEQMIVIVINPGSHEYDKLGDRYAQTYKQTKALPVGMNQCLRQQVIGL